MNLSGKTVVVLGASGGIGERLCETLTKNYSASVAVADINEVAAENLAQKLKKCGGDVAPYWCDITDQTSVDRLVHEAERQFGQIDIWINCVGVSVTSSFGEIGKEDFRRIMEVNFSSVVDTCRLLLDYFTEKGSGVIVNVSSVAGDIASPCLSAYVSSKHALNGFTRSLQYELEINGSPVSTLLVCPGFVKTEMTSGIAGMKFPQWLSFALTKPEKVADQIVEALKKRKTECTPTMNGKIMRSAKLTPRFLHKISHRALMSNTLKDFLWNKLDDPDSKA